MCAKKSDKKPICFQLLKIRNLHTGPGSYIDRSIYVAVMEHLAEHIVLYKGILNEFG